MILVSYKKSPVRVSEKTALATNSRVVRNFVLDMKMVEKAAIKRRIQPKLQITAFLVT